MGAIGKNHALDLPVCVSVLQKLTRHGEAVVRAGKLQHEVGGIGPIASQGHPTGGYAGAEPNGVHAAQKSTPKNVLLYDHVLAIAKPKEISVSPGSPAQGVVTRLGVNQVRPLTAIDIVIALTPVQGVVTIAATKDIDTCATFQGIVACTAIQRVVAGQSVQGIRAGTTCEHIAPRIAHQGGPISRSGHQVCALCPNVLKSLFGQERLDCRRQWGSIQHRGQGLVAAPSYGMCCVACIAAQVNQVAYRVQAICTRPSLCKCQQGSRVKAHAIGINHQLDRLQIGTQAGLHGHGAINAFL